MNWIWRLKEKRLGQTEEHDNWCSLSFCFRCFCSNSAFTSALVLTLCSASKTTGFTAFVFWMIDRVGVESISCDAPDWYNASADSQSLLPKSSIHSLIRFHYGGQLHFVLHKTFQKMSVPVWCFVFIFNWPRTELAFKKTHFILFM